MGTKLSMDEPIEYFEGKIADTFPIERFYRKLRKQKVNLLWNLISQVESSERYFFCHELLPRDPHIVPTSDYAPFFHKIIDKFMKDNKIKYNKITRSCLNLTYHIPGQKWGDPHVDNYFDHYSVILYLNNSVGDTIVFDKTVPFDGKHEGLYYYKDFDWDNDPPMEVKYRSAPEVGKIVLFRGDQLHTYQTPDPGDLRLVCVYNLSY